MSLDYFGVKCDRCEGSGVLRRTVGFSSICEKCGGVGTLAMPAAKPGVSPKVLITAAVMALVIAGIVLLAVLARGI